MTEDDRRVYAEIEAARSKRPTFTDGEPIASWRPRSKPPSEAGIVVLLAAGAVLLLGLLAMLVAGRS